MSAERNFKKRNELHLLRKSWHVLAGLTGYFLFLYSGYSADFWACLAMVLALLVFVLEFFRLKDKSLKEFVCRGMGPLMRNSEQESLRGMPFYALGVSLTLFFYPVEIAQLAVLFLIFSDPFSALMGVLFGQKKILPNKSYVGSLSGVFCCSLISLLYFYQSLPAVDLFIFSLLAGLIGSFSELISAFGIDDNLTIPVVSGAGLWGLGQLLGFY